MDVPQHDERNAHSNGYWSYVEHVTHGWGDEYDVGVETIDDGDDDVEMSESEN